MKKTTITTTTSSHSTVPNTHFSYLLFFLRCSHSRKAQDEKKCIWIFFLYQLRDDSHSAQLSSAQIQLCAQLIICRLLDMLYFFQFRFYECDSQRLTLLRIIFCSRRLFAAILFICWSYPLANQPMLSEFCVQLRFLISFRIYFLFSVALILINDGLFSITMKKVCFCV